MTQFLKDQKVNWSIISSKLPTKSIAKLLCKQTLLLRNIVVFIIYFDDEFLGLGDRCQRAIDTIHMFEIYSEMNLDLSGITFNGFARFLC